MKKLSLMLLLMCGGLSSYLQAKVLIITYAYNRPDFIELQDRTFKKFLKDDYIFVVFNDATEKKAFNEIRGKCSRLNIPCYDIPQTIHHGSHEPSIRNGNVVNYSLEKIGFDFDGVVALFDSDLFLIKDFSLEEYLKGYDISGLSQIYGGKKYMWIGIVFLDMRTLPNKKTLRFDCGRVDGTWLDAGGYSHTYLKNNPEAKVRWFNWHVYIDKPIFDREFLSAHGYSDPLVELLIKGVDDIELFQERTLLHYRGGTNWNNKPAEYHNFKRACLYEFIDKITTV